MVLSLCLFDVAKKFDYEVELVSVIGKQAKNVYRISQKKYCGLKD